MSTDHKNYVKSDSDSLLLVEEKDQTVILTMNRPKVMNCLNFDLLYAIRDKIDALQYRTDIRTVIITGAGEKSFCAGADLKERAGLNPEEVKKIYYHHQKPSDLNSKSSHTCDLCREWDCTWRRYGSGPGIRYPYCL